MQVNFDGKNVYFDNAWSIFVQFGQNLPFFDPFCSNIISPNKSKSVLEKIMSLEKFCQIEDAGVIAVPIPMENFRPQQPQQPVNFSSCRPEFD
jgi:hypothetical protein